MKFQEVTRLMVFKFIEAHLEQYEYVGPKHLAKAFKVHRTQSSKLFREYKQHTTCLVLVRGEDREVNNLHMNDDGKTYVKSDIYRRKYLGGEDPAVFLDAVGVVFAATGIETEGAGSNSA